MIGTHTACAIGAAHTGNARGTARASASTIDVGFVAILHAVFTCRRRTQQVYAHPAGAIIGGGTAHIGETRFTGSTAVHIGLIAVAYEIVTGGLNAEFIHTHTTVAISGFGTGQAHAAWVALTTTIDI